MSNSQPVGDTGCGGPVATRPAPDPWVPVGRGCPSGSFGGQSLVSYRAN